MNRDTPQKACVNFVGTVSANSTTTLISQEYRRPFKLFLIRAHFALNTNRKLRLYFYVSPDDSQPTALPLTGSNILQEGSHTTYIVGDDEQKEIWQDFYAHEGGQFVKVYADNQDNFDHTIDVQAFIELH